MKIRFSLALATVIAGLAGCAGPEKKAPTDIPVSAVEKNVGVDYLSSFGPVVGEYSLEDVRRVYRALRVNDEVKFSKSRKGNSPYRKLFGSDEISAAKNFLKRRVHGWTFDPLVAEVTSIPATAFAANIGPLYWHVANTAPQTKNTVEQAFLLPIETLRKGFFYIKPNTYPYSEFLARAQVILDFSTLIHEARHSDCAQEKSGPKSRCFQTHVACSYAADRGRIACDPNYAGAHTLGYVVAEELAERCRNCEGLAKSFLKLHALASIRQVNVLPNRIRRRIDGLDKKLQLVLRNSGSPETGKTLRAFFVELTKIVREVNGILLNARDFRL
jgi:hypothetical protein